MTPNYAHTLLLVDDEVSILKSLQRVFRKEPYTIITAVGGKEALQKLAKDPASVSLIVTDQRMPEMTGDQFLEQAIHLAPEAMRFILTGYADLNAVIDAVNKGKIHRYVTKPWNAEELLEQVRNALAQVELRLENKRLRALTEQQNQALLELNKTLEKKVDERTWALQIQNRQMQAANAGLEKNLMETIRLLTSLVESSNPRLGRYMKAVSGLVRELAADAGMDKTEQNNVEMAGLVHDIGLIGIPEEIIEKDIKIMSAEELESYAQHPMIAAISLSALHKFKAISEIVSAHHENVDGSGFPHGLKSHQIPMGAKLLAVAADYHTIIHFWPKSIQRMLSFARRYLDPDTVAKLDITDESLRTGLAEQIVECGINTRYDSAVVKLLLKRLAGQRPYSGIMRLPAQGLRKGMLLMQDLRLKDGRLLLTRSTTISERLVQSIQSIIDRGLFEGLIEVAEPKGPSPDATDHPGDA